MKEAAGEANMTVITIVLIAVVLAVGTVIVNNLLSTTAKKSACQEIGGTLAGNTCTYPNGTGGTTNCTITKCQNSNGYSCIPALSCDRT